MFFKSSFVWKCFKVLENVMKVDLQVDQINEDQFEIAILT